MSSASHFESVTSWVFISVALVTAVADVMTRVARRFNQPAVVGEMIAGIALGPSVLGLLPGNLTEFLFPAEVRGYLAVIAQLGIVLFMFVVGYELPSAQPRNGGRQVAAISVASFAVPFALGMSLATVLHPWHRGQAERPVDVLELSLFLGVAMAVTAFPVLARIVSEHGLRRSRLGSLSLASAAIQDFVAWCVFAVVVARVAASGQVSMVLMIGESLLFVVAMVVVVRPLLLRFLAARERTRSSAAVYTIAVVGLLLSSWITTEIGLHAIFGAFAFGAVMPRRVIEHTAPEVPVRIEQTSLLLLPAFFMITGSSVNLTELGWVGCLEFLVACVVACMGKFGAAAAAARLTGFDRRESTIIGILINTRGLTELIILQVGLSIGVIDARLFTVMVMMALVTTAIPGPLLRRLITTVDCTQEVNSQVRAERL